MTEEKDVELSIRIKEIALGEQDDTKFLAILDETVEAIKTRITDARKQFQVFKTAQIDGQPTLADKGVEVGITVRF